MKRTKRGLEDKRWKSGTAKAGINFKRAIRLSSASCFLSAIPGRDTCHDYVTHWTSTLALSKDFKVFKLIHCSARLHLIDGLRGRHMLKGWSPVFRGVPLSDNWYTVPPGSGDELFFTHLMIQAHCVSMRWMMVTEYFSAKGDTKFIHDHRYTIPNYVRTDIPGDSVLGHYTWKSRKQ